MTIIKPIEVQQGDKIAVTVKGQYTDREHSATYTGVAHHSEVNPVGIKWYTEADWSLFTHDANAVIELLDRPKPKIVLPKGIGAVVEYTVSFDPCYPKRTALRALDGSWKCYNDLGEENDDYPNNEEFAEFLESANFTHTVLFEGVAK